VQEEKLANSQSIIDGFRERTQALDDKHDELTLEKAQVALDFAVRLGSLPNWISLLMHTECGRSSSQGP